MPLVVTGLLGSVVGGCAWSFLGLSDLIYGPTSEDLTRPEIESIAAIRFPPGARNIHAYAEDFRGAFSDPQIWVRFEMPPDQLYAFLATTRCPPTLEQQSAPTTQPGGGQPGGGSLPAWWDPHKFRTLEGTSVGPDVNPAQQIRVGTTESGDYVVFLYAFSI
jgi:hypothetical protein